MALAAPVTRDGFSFSGDTFSVLASNGNVHRRATLPELREHYSSSDDKPAHWYEAQLLHYGLKASKVKGTAKMRLHDAVCAAEETGGLQVPEALRALETSMKKEWSAMNKGAAKARQETKKETKPKPKTAAGTIKEAKPKPKAAAGTKRKADDDTSVTVSSNGININMSFSVGDIGGVKQGPAKKAKSEKSAAIPKTAGPKKPKTGTAQKASASKATAPKKAATPKTAKPKVEPEDEPTVVSGTPKPRTKQTARRSKPFTAAGITRTTFSSTSISVPASAPVRGPQYARRGGISHPGLTRSQATPRQEYGADDYETTDGWGGYSDDDRWGGYDDDDDDDDDEPPPPYPGPPDSDSDSDSDSWY